MATYKVTIQATVTKAYTVQANSEQEASKEAHQIFSVLEDGTPENYTQETISVERAK